MHIFEWLEIKPKTEAEQKAKIFLDFRTRPAMTQLDNEHKIQGLKIYCIYKLSKYRITGASRLGDVWLCKASSKEALQDLPQYEKRVDIEDCSNFSFIDQRIKS